jgi:hypothetical protein
VLNPAYWLKHPQLILPRIRYWFWERRHPDAPWLSPGAVEFCERHLSRDMIGLEFGSGRSTAWFGQRLGWLTSVEHDEPWYQRVRRILQTRQCNNIDYRFVPLNHRLDEPEQERYDPLPAYVAVLSEFADASLDLVVVDGHYRTACIRRAPAKLKPGGMLLIDDVGLWRTNKGPPVPAEWPLLSLTSNGLKQTGIWQKPPLE